MNDWQLTRSVRTTSGEVRWDTLGSPRDTNPVVLLHGTRSLTHSLARDRQVFVWDMPGYGTSEKFPGQD